MRKYLINTNLIISILLINLFICKIALGEVIKKIENSKPEKALNFLIELIEKNIPAANWKEILQTWNKKADIQFGVIMQSLRLAIVGSLTGPDIFNVCGLLEKEVTLRRLKKLIIYLNN